MKTDILKSLAWGGGIVALALLATFARSQGLIDTETVNRIVMGSIGLMVVWFGNRMPKTLALSAQARDAQRVGGWSMVLSGLIYAGLWAFAPHDVAVIGGSAAVLIGIAVTVGYCLMLRGRAAA